MPHNNLHKLRIIFYAVWLALLLLQASFTELLSDEAYYWFYSTRLGLGYFDHPPMIAFLIRAGTEIFPGELGVRFFPVILSFAAVLIVEQMLEKKDFLLYAALVSSILMLQLGVFLAVPDTPYLFFIAVFLFLFKKYTEKPGRVLAVLTGLTAACILYSKYHGAMLLVFLVTGNTALLKKPVSYLGIAVFLLAYFPHILWLVENDYPSFGYHFGERNIPAYTPLFTLEYILGQVAILGPVTSFFLFYALYRYKASDAFGRSLKVSAWGVFIFLFLFSFKGTIEANWSLAALWPLLIMAHAYLAENRKWRRIFLYTVPFSVFILLLLRVYWIYDFTAGTVKLPIALYHKKEWAQHLHSRTGGVPVVFINSYQDASLYSFYSHSPAISLNNIRGRMNQYSLSPLEEELRGRKVAVVPNWYVAGADSFFIGNKLTRWVPVETFASHSKVYFKNNTDGYRVKPREKFSLNVRVSSRFCDGYSFVPVPGMDPYISYHYFKGRELVSEGSTGIKLEPDMLEKDLSLSIPAPTEPGEYDLRISVQTGWLPPTFNSKKWKVSVSESDD